MLSVHAKSLQSCLTLCNLIDLARQPPCPWDSPGRNTGVGCPPPEDLPNPGCGVHTITRNHQPDTKYIGRAS